MTPNTRKALLLLTASFASLFFELLIIRYLSSEIRAFAYLKNVPLIASFLGLGLGMLRPKGQWAKKLPIHFCFLFILTAAGFLLGFNLAGFPQFDYHTFGNLHTEVAQQLVMFYVIVVFYLWLIIGFFRGLGEYVATTITEVPGLLGYGVNLAGGLLGVLVFALLSWLQTPPTVWLIVGIVSILPFFLNGLNAIVWMCAVTLLTGLTAMPAIWSQYYRVDFDTSTVKNGRAVGVAQLSVNHSYHQRMLDLSPAYLNAHPEAELNHSALRNYELPYMLEPSPNSVLIVGAGTGNDVAAALRHRVQRVDAVEIDRAIYDIGRRMHPEQPYANPAVTVHITDARAFFNGATPHSYDLIVFAYLDAHTMLSSYSSLRLDNFVYTVESLRAARQLLRPNGTMVLAFDSGRQFVDDRIATMLKIAFDGVVPHVYATGYDGLGLAFVEGAARQRAPLTDPQEQSSKYHTENVIPATDNWPFLYLRSKAIPFGILSVLVIFLAGAAWLLRGTFGVQGLRNPDMLHFFALGAAFLLLETKGVTQLSLLFGSTWVTNTVVIAGFLLMAILSNAVATTWKLSKSVAYAGLVLAILFDWFFPYASLMHLGDMAKILAATGLIGLPVFFSGLIFSVSFRSASDRTKALGANLLGATVGGALENVVMIVGIPILTVLAFCLYLAAFAADRKSSAQTFSAAT
jgi:spermidine synthase